MNLIETDDVKNHLARTQNKFHFVLSDLPYEMKIVGKEWDDTGIAFDVELYKMLLDVMLPGGFGAFYGFSRTHHKVMTALESAGWIIHKAIFAWVYPDGNAQGAPNTQRNADNKFAQRYGGYCTCENITPIIRHGIGYLDEKFASQGLDVQFCANCDKPVKLVISTIQHSASGGMVGIGGPGYGNSNVQVITQPLTVESKALMDYTYGLGWGKPLLEPIMIVQAPYGKESEINNVITNGTGVVNKSGKHPGNFIYMHTPMCTAEKCADDCLANELNYNYQGLFYDPDESKVFSTTKVRAEKHIGLDYENKHPSVKPLAVNKHLGQIFLPPSIYGLRRALVPFSGSGSEVIGLTQAGWDYVESVEIDPNYAQTHLDRYYHYFPNNEVILIDETIL